MIFGVLLLIMNDEIYDLKKLKLLMMAIGAGLVVGSIGVIFEMLIDLADDLWKHHTFIIYLLPIFGMLIIFITNKLKENNIDGPNQLIYSLNNNHNIKPVQGILIFIATTLSHHLPWRLNYLIFITYIIL